MNVACLVMEGNLLLLVDDDKDFRTLIRSLLRHHGYEVTSVDCGVAAIDSANTLKFGLIIMDWHMPDLDGFETAKRIWQESKFNSATKIVALTSSDSPFEVERCIEHGFTDVLSKSSAVDGLLELLRKHYQPN
jgi:CheY-like chemotaxis protein